MSSNKSLKNAFAMGCCISLNMKVRELARVVERLAEAFQPERIYVFGSQTRGEATSDSDIDLLIIVAQADEPAHRLAQAAYRIAAPHSLALDLSGHAARRV